LDFFANDALLSYFKPLNVTTVRSLLDFYLDIVHGFSVEVGLLLTLDAGAT
jgi:hypothetical protein